MNVLIRLRNNEQIMLRGAEREYQLCRPRTRKTKTNDNPSLEWEAFGYFASLPQALGRIADMKIRSSDAATLTELAAEVRAVRKELTSGWGH